MALRTPECYAFKASNHFSPGNLKTDRNGLFLNWLGWRDSASLLRSFAKKCKHFFASIASPTPELLQAKVIRDSDPDSSVKIKQQPQRLLFYFGWDEGIRTPECWYQKPVPYHLATSQYIILKLHTSYEYNCWLLALVYFTKNHVTVKFILNFLRPRLSRWHSSSGFRPCRLPLAIFTLPLGDPP